MTDREKKIAEIREFYRYHPEDNMNKLNVNFLLSELDRIKNIADDLNNEVFGLRMMLKEEHEEECTQENPCKMCLRDSVEGYKNIVQELEEENRKLREERDKLIEGLRWYADEDTHEIKRRTDGDYAPITLDRGKRACDILKGIGVTVDE